MKSFTSITTLLILLCTTGGLFATSTNWTGSIDTDWNNPGNWTNGVPDASDEVGIADMPIDPIISTSDAIAKTVIIANGGILTITSAGVLTLDVPTNNVVPLTNNPQSTLVNEGVINIGLTTSVGSLGLANHGTFNNNAGGQINILHVNSTGLHNAATGVFNNAGNITIGGRYYPLQNLGTFNNNTGGQLTITGSPDCQIGLDNGVSNGTAIFTNAGNISIGASQSTGVYGIQNKATFNNIAGQITIDHSPSGGLFNFGGTFNNSATIVLGSVPGLGNLGMENNNGTFNNQAGGQITINYGTTFGILHRSGTLDNSGTITIGNIAGNGLYGIEIRSTFNNNAGGQIHIDQSATAALFLNNTNLNNAGTVVIGQLVPINFLKTTNAAFVNGTGGIVAGSGYVSGPNNFVNSGGTLVPGYDTTGILTFGFSSNFSNLILSIEVNGVDTPGVDYDQLVTSNAPGLAGGTLDVSINYSPSIGDRIVILKSSVHLTDTFPTVTGLPANWHLYYSPTEISLIYGPLQSTWTGAVSTDWYDAGNWTAGVPHVMCQAIIPDMANDPLIPAAGAVAMSVTVQGGASLTLAAAGALTIKTLVSQGLLNQGTLQNDGVINLSSNWTNSSTYNGNYYGIRNEAIFNNNTGATLNLDNPFEQALYNDTLGTFSNQGSIIIGANAVTGISGIENRGTFDNQTGGQISIDRLSIGGSAFTNLGLFNNDANINVGTSVWSNPMSVGIANGGIFNNNTGGQIHIDRVNYAMYQAGASPFNNHAMIHIGSLSGGSTIAGGIFNLIGKIINHTSGQIYMDRVTTGILAYGDTLVNAGTFTIGALTPVTNLVENIGVGVVSNNTGGTFKGTGNITAERFIHAGGTLTPGHPFGTMTFTAGEDFSSSILNIDIRETGGVVSNDLVSVNGNASLTGGTLNLVAAGTVPYGIYQLMSLGSNAGSTLFTTVNFPSTCTGCALVYMPTAVWLNNPNTCATNLTLNNQALPTGTYRSQGDLTATMSTVENGGNVEFKSDTGVLLQADFTVPLGGVFEVTIAVCQ